MKKNLEADAPTRRSWIEPNHPDFSLRRQCELLGLSRAGLYREPPENLRLIDEQYLATPFYGGRRMADWPTRRGEGEIINRKRVQRPMRILGPEAIHPGPKTTNRSPDHEIPPYLLRGVTIGRRDQVRSTDVTYRPLKDGYMFLAAVIDWRGRFVLSWRLSNTLDGRFCLDASNAALKGGRPEIFNTDQGSQFTAKAFTGRLKEAGIAISMDGRGERGTTCSSSDCGGP